MGRNISTPQDLETKRIISENLNRLLSASNSKKIDVVNQTGITQTSVYNYFSGDALPSKQNLEKLANFFHVDKSEIDPRFSTEKDTTITDEDLEKALDNAHSFDGKPMDDHDRQIIKDILRGYFKNKD